MGSSSEHGSPANRGSMDAYYGRRRNPHKREAGVDTPLSDPAEVAAYNEAFEAEEDRKDWGQ